MQGNSEGSPGQEEVQINIFMWKVMIIICTLGNPCTIFEQDPVMYYETEAECMAVAQKKEALLLGSFLDLGHTITISDARCNTAFTSA